MNNLKLIFVVTLVSFLSYNSISQEVVTPNKKYLGASISTGTDGSNTFFKYELLVAKNNCGISIDYMYGTSSIKNKEFFDKIVNTQINGIGKIGKNSYLQIGIGFSFLAGIKRKVTPIYGHHIDDWGFGQSSKEYLIGYEYEPENYSCYGIPITTKFNFDLNKSIGFNIGGYANINGVRNIYTFLIGITYFSL